MIELLVVQLFVLVTVHRHQSRPPTSRQGSLGLLTGYGSNSDDDEPSPKRTAVQLTTQSSSKPSIVSAPHVTLPPHTLPSSSSRTLSSLSSYGDSDDDEPTGVAPAILNKQSSLPTVTTGGSSSSHIAGSIFAGLAAGAGLSSLLKPSAAPVVVVSSNVTTTTTTRTVSSASSSSSVTSTTTVTERTVSATSSQPQQQSQSQPRSQSRGPTPLVNQSSSSSLTASSTDPAVAMRVLPPPPLSSADQRLQDKIRLFINKSRDAGVTFNSQLAKRPETANPGLLTKLAKVYNIDQGGSNYSPSIFDPSALDPADYYDAINKQLRQDEEALLAARQAGTAGVEFTSGAPLVPTGLMTAPGGIVAAPTASLPVNAPATASTTAASTAPITTGGRRRKWDQPAPTAGVAISAKR